MNSSGGGFVGKTEPETLFDMAFHCGIDHSNANVPVHAAANMNSLIQANLI